MNSIGFAVSMMAGCALGLLLIGRFPAGLDPVYGWGLQALALASFLPALLSRGSSRRTFRAALLAAACLAGCGRTLLTHPPVTPHDLAFYNAPPDSSTLSASVSVSSTVSVSVTGIIAAEPVFSDRSQTLRIASRSITLRDRPTPVEVSGDMYAVVPRFPEFSTGEVLSLSGRLTDPPGFAGFDYAGYLARQGVFSYMSFPRVSGPGLGLRRSDEDWPAVLLASVRAQARNALQSAIVEPEASIAVGVVLGDRTTFSDHDKQVFIRSGTTHILAISGQNISLLVGVVWLVYTGGQRRQRMPAWLALAVLLLIATYSAFTGASPSVVRAAIMGAILLLGPVLGRRYDPVAAISVSAAAMVTLDPDLLADAGFQLSFCAMLGIVFLAQHIYPFLNRLHVPDLIAYPFAAGMGAFIATFPLGILISGQVSLVAPFATLTADFALLPLMISGILTAICGFAPLLAAIPAIFAWLSSWWLLTNAQLWSSLPFSAIPVQNLNIAYLIAYYAVLSSGIYVLTNKRLTIRLPSLHQGMGFALLALLALATWAIAIALLLASP